MCEFIFKLLAAIFGFVATIVLAYSTLGNHNDRAEGGKLWGL
jgi:hypothetical protein